MGRGTNLVLDIIALEELPSGQVPAYEAVLADRFPYHSVQGTVGLWSKYPMSNTRPVDIKMGWTRAMRSTVTTPKGEAIAYERLGKVILLGDLNGTMNDRSLNEVTSQMRSTQGAAGDGFGWLASSPMARIDQIMVKGVEPMSSWTLPATDSDHLPIAARVEL
ncbi:endonuclease/exonuclease/phosphatase family protein [Streptomyces sp. NPDC056227]|uniref:endonuclease/exonuclease/phosphatase family protein n=1 Tax=Streptomyces sp. NPDC056227 TaxID=3345753 RepID=UPI0035DA8BB2